MKRILLLFILFFVSVGVSSTAAEEHWTRNPWATSLSHDGGGVWTERYPFTFENNTTTSMSGRPMSLRFDDVAFPIPNVREIRVTKADGRELLFAAYSAEGKQLFDGTFPKDGFLVVPVDCEPGEKANFFIYFNNEQAEIVPDFLDAKPGFVNGDLEAGDGEYPDGWASDQADEQRQNRWVEADSTFSPKSGKKCLKTVIQPDSKPSWFAARQHSIPVVAGAKYRLSAWVRAEDVQGQAGWYVHVGNEKNSQVINSVRNAGSGTFDWKEIVYEFTAPDDADRATIGTVLYGTGTAWFDAVSFEGENDEEIPETYPCDRQMIPYRIIPADGAWPDVKPRDYLCRSTFRIMNDSKQDMIDVPVLMTLRGTLAHGLRGPLVDLFIKDEVHSEGKRIPVSLLDEENGRISARLTVPSKSIKYFNVYYRFDESRVPEGIELKRSDLGGESDTAHPELQSVVDPFADLPNLLENGNFEDEAADGSASAWRRNENNPPEGVRYSVESDPKIVRFGKRCARLDVSEDAPKNWRGLTQQVPVRPGRPYLVQGWIKTENAGPCRIHVHFHDASGKHTQSDSMTSIGPDVAGTSDWTRLTEILTTPSDARSMSVHLTTDAAGTVWHDNVAVFDGLFAEQVDRESYFTGPDDFEGPFFWQVPAVAKVFPQTIPGRSIRESEHSKIRIETARNEKESLQLAFRTDEESQWSINVRPLRHISDSSLDNSFPFNEGTGFKLDDFETNVVGYVPVDYPSSYYNEKTPRWYRKTPTSAPGCDGWKGLWPDPLLPTNRLKLKPNQTESVWITWKIPKNAPAGTYQGSVFIWKQNSDKTIDPSKDEKQFIGRGINIEIVVRDFTLPDENHLTAIYDVRLGPGGPKYWGKPEAECYEEIVDFMTDNRLAPDKISPDVKVEFQDGKFRFDWTEFDKSAERLLDEKKLQRIYTPYLFYLFGWGHPPKDFFGEKPYPGDWPFQDADFSKLRPEYKTRYQAALREFWNHVTEKGWADRFVLYISDEPSHWTPHIVEQMKALCEMIHEVDPNIPIYSSTWHYIPEWKDSIDVWGIGHYGLVPVETMQKIRDDGSRIWFTTDGMLCLDTPYSAIERLLPYYCFKYGAEAYEFWGVSWLTYNPFERGSHAYIHQTSTPGEYYWVRYPNGDGYLIYPGGLSSHFDRASARRDNPLPLVADSEKRNRQVLSSVRFEQAREGVEDFEYFYLLFGLIEKAKESGKDVSRAEAAIQAARDMVDCPSPTGRYSSKILPNPDRLYEVRRQLAEAIEALK